MKLCSAAEVTLGFPFGSFFLDLDHFCGCTQSFAVFRTGRPSVPKVIMDCLFLADWFFHKMDSNSCQMVLPAVFQPDLCTEQRMVSAPVRREETPQVNLDQSHQWHENSFRWPLHEAHRERSRVCKAHLTIFVCYIIPYILLYTFNVLSNFQQCKK